MYQLQTSYPVHQARMTHNQTSDMQMFAHTAHTALGARAYDQLSSIA